MIRFTLHGPKHNSFFPPYVGSDVTMKIVTFAEELERDPFFRDDRLCGGEGEGFTGNEHGAAKTIQPAIPGFSSCGVHGPDDRNVGVFAASRRHEQRE